MELESELNTFLASDEKTFLLRGKWGVGKTTAVENWLRTIKSEEINWKPIRLSLFGISDVNELNTRLIRESSLLGKIGKYSNKLGVEVSAEYYAGLSFSLGGLFDVLAEENFKREQKKNKRKITKYLIILDDIERKDFHLSLDEVFGFIDQINPNRSKIIAITNSDYFQNDLDFYHFKEKVFNREFYLDKPTLALKKKLFGKDSLFEKLSIADIDNLRTILRCKKCVELSELKDDSVGLIRLNAVVRALDSIDNGKFGKEVAMRHYLEDAERLLKMSDSSKPFNKEKEEQDYISKHKDFTKGDYFAEFFEDKEPFNCIANRNEFLSTIYQLVDGLKYELIKDIGIEFSNSPYPRFHLDLDFGEFKKGNAEYINKVLGELDNSLNSEIEEASLFYELCKVGYYLSLSPKIEEVTSRFEKVSSRIIKHLSKRMIEAQYWWGDKIEAFYLSNFVGKQEAYEPYLKLLNKEVLKDVFERFATVDAFPNAESRDRVIAIFHFAHYDPNKNETEFADLVKSLVYTYIERLAQNADYLTYAFDFLYETQFDRKKIKAIIDERLANNIPDKIKTRLDYLNRQYFN